MINFIKKIRNMRNIISFVAVFVIAFQFSFSQEELTLERAIKKTLQNNYTINLSKVSNSIAENNVNIGNAGFLPRLDGTLGYNQRIIDQEIILNPQTTIVADNARNTTINGGLELSWTLFDGFAMFAQYDRLEALKSRSDIELQIAIENNLQDIISSFYNVLKIQESLVALKLSLSLSKSRLEELNTRLEFASVSSYDILQAKIAYNNDSASYLLQSLQLYNAKRNLFFLMGEKTDKDYTLVGNSENLLDMNLMQIKEMAFQKNSSINIALKEKEISDADRRTIVSAYYPRLEFRGGYTYSQNENPDGFPQRSTSDGYNFGFNLAVNLFDGFRTRTQQENQELALEMLDISIEQTRAVIDLNIMMKYENFIKLDEVYRLQEMNLESAKLARQRAEELYKLGKISSIEDRETQLNLIRAEQQILDLKFDLRIVESELLLLTGQLFEKFK